MVPLRLFILTPLVLNRFSKLELDAFFLFSSSLVLSSVVEFRVGDTFDKMLSYAFAGGRDLSPKQNLTAVGSGEPNWALFLNCRKTQKSLIVLLMIPVAAICIGLGWWSLGRLLNWDYTNNDIWAGFWLSVTSALLSIGNTVLQSSLKATDRVAECNRIGLLSTFLTIILSAIAISLGARLAIVGAVQLLFVIGVWLILYIRQPQEIRAPEGRGWSFDKRVLDWAWKPLWKGILVQATTFGAARSAGLFLAGSLLPGQLAQFMFAQNLLVTLGNFGGAATLTQIPRYARLLTIGRGKEVANDGSTRVGLAVGLMLLGVGLAAIGAGPILRVIGSKVIFIDVKCWIIFGIGYTIFTGQNLLAIVYDVTNQQVLYRHCVAAAICVVVSLSVMSAVQAPLWAYCLAINLPYIIIINFLSIRWLAVMGEVSVKECFIWVCKGPLVFCSRLLR